MRRLRDHQRDGQDQRRRGNAPRGDGAPVTSDDDGQRGRGEEQHGQRRARVPERHAGHRSRHAPRDRRVARPPRARRRFQTASRGRNDDAASASAPAARVVTSAIRRELGAKRLGAGLRDGVGARVADQELRADRARGDQVDRREAPRLRQRAVQRDDRGLAADRLRRGRDDRQRAAVDDVAGGRQGAARRVRRQRVEAVDQDDDVAAARRDALGGVDRTLDRLARRVGRRAQ